MINAAIKAIEYYYPEQVLKNEELADQFEGWTAEKITKKTGISQRHIASATECASDLAYQAASKLFKSGACAPNDIDFILLCTQSPDYFLPTTACILQDKLGIPTHCGALDFNLGCSGYIYGLSLAKGLIETQQAKNVLLVTAETYSKYIAEDDVSTRTIFGDAAAATLVSATQSETPMLSSFVYGTDGSGAENLIVKNGAHREPNSDAKRIFMNGPEIFAFTLKSVPAAIDALLTKEQIEMDNIDYFVFHQANEFMLSHLRKKIGIPADKFYMDMSDCGNTVSSTIPIALKNALTNKTIQPGDRVALVGFGVGYSSGACLVSF